MSGYGEIDDEPIDLTPDEMIAATGLPDLIGMGSIADGLASAYIPDGYATSDPADSSTILFVESGQPFEVWAIPFLEALKDCGTVRKALADAGITRREYRLAIKYQPHFEEAVEDARADFADKIEEKILSELRLDTEAPMDPKAYALAYRVLQAHARDRYGLAKGRSTKSMTDEQRKYLTTFLVRQGITPTEAQALIDHASSAIRLAAETP